MSKSRIMEFAENLQMMQNQRKEVLTKIKKKNLVMSEKNRIFASENDEPTVLAIDSGKPIPTLEGLKRELAFQKYFLEIKEKEVQERKDKITKLENKIKDLEKQLDGKS